MLKNKHEYQSFGMKISDRIFRHKNVIVLSFRKVYSKKVDEVTELAEDASAEASDKKFSEILALLVQDQVAKKVAQELNVETDTWPESM